jgi:hypothetical protein
MARRRFIRYRRPSLKTMLGMTRARKRMNRQLGITAAMLPFRAPGNMKRRMLRRAGYYSGPVKFFRFIRRLYKKSVARIHTSIISQGADWTKSVLLARQDKSAASSGEPGQRRCKSSDQQTNQPGTGTCRVLFDCPDLLLTAIGPCSQKVEAKKLDSPVTGDGRV